MFATYSFAFGTDAEHASQREPHRIYIHRQQVVLTDIGQRISVNGLIVRRALAVIALCVRCCDDAQERECDT